MGTRKKTAGRKKTKRGGRPDRPVLPVKNRSIPDNLQVLLNTGLQAHQNGDLDRAGHCYQQVLDQVPDHPKALELSGVLFAQQGQPELAVARLQRALKADPGNLSCRSNMAHVHHSLKEHAKVLETVTPVLGQQKIPADIYNHYGNALRGLDRLDEAIQAYQQALAIEPSFPEAWSNLACSLARAGRHENAVDAFQTATRLNPNDWELLRLLGVSQLETGDISQAEATFRTVLRKQPLNLNAWNDLGSALLQSNQTTEAKMAFSKVLSHEPGSTTALLGLGLACQQLRDGDSARKHYRRALELDPQRSDIYRHLADSLRFNGFLEKALEHYQIAWERGGKQPETLEGWAACLQLMGRCNEAVSVCHRCQQEFPDHSRIEGTLGMIDLLAGDPVSAVNQFRSVLGADPQNQAVYSSLLFAFNYVPDLSPEDVFQSHLDWGRQLDLLSDLGAFRNDPDPHRKIRIGYVSPDLRRHSVAFFIQPVLQHYDRSCYEVTCYSNWSKPDAVTAELKVLVDNWRQIENCDDSKCRELIRQDGIDILIDLAGHTAENRLPLFAGRSAPIQVTWIGYPNTTGLSTMDYRLTDRWADPENVTDAYHTERLVRLPTGFSCYSPPDSDRVPAPPPVLGNKHITFGSFNNISKLNERVVALWTEILLAVPGSRLLLKSPNLADPYIQNCLKKRFEVAGLPLDRLDLIPFADSFDEHLSLYHRVDIALDPFPFNGATTTCEALWMGLPVVALAGKTHAGRVSCSMLYNVGLTELVASDEDHYRNIAVALAHDPEALTSYHSTIRDRLLSSDLVEPVCFTRAVETAFRQMWRQWCLEQA